jgi:hypothetical protein
MTRPAARELLAKTYAAFNARDIDGMEGGRVRDRGGAVLADRMVQHVYVIEDGLIRSMEIKE